jgi:transposase
MLQQAHSYRLFVGIDVSARTCTVVSKRAGDNPSPALTIDQTPAGFIELRRHLLVLESDSTAILVVMEATGTYWMRLALPRIGAQIAVSVVNPTQAHDFAKTLLKRSETDAIDAQMLSELAARLQPQSTPRP